MPSGSSAPHAQRYPLPSAAAQPDLRHLDGLRQRGPEHGAPGPGTAGHHDHTPDHTGPVSAAAGPAPPPAAVCRHGPALPGGCLQPGRGAPDTTRWLWLPAGCHLPPWPQVHSAECPAARGAAGRGDPAVRHLAAQLLPAGRRGPGAGGRGGPVTCAHRLPPLGLHPAQLPPVRALQPGQLLPAGPHLRPHRPRPGQPHCCGQPRSLPAPVRQPPQHPQLRGHRAHPHGDVPLPQLRGRGLLGCPPGLLAEETAWQGSLRPGRVPGPSGTAPRSPDPTLAGGRGTSGEQAGSRWAVGGRGAFGKGPLGGWMGSPSETPPSLPASPHPRAPLTTGWWVHAWHGHCACQSNYYSYRQLRRKLRPNFDDLFVF